ncbi:methyl-accepting chemotaxis protein [Mangrovibacter sp. MFB070]|uniref:methyl-accepting chemotaxis protein n=1 Tax=Mangrovibacter sp. MFB070 TaxID=1224318 RepID=UPI000AF6CA30|nr:methyl-accepting chemotaxis protein [Mangrovibacter sp. MFB070]
MLSALRLNQFRIGPRLWLLSVLLLVLTLCAGAIGGYVNYHWTKSSQKFIAREMLIEQSIDTARNAQVQFKIQVQEWKDTLLRGVQGGDLFTKYKAAFLEQNDKTQALLNTLSQQLPALGMSNQDVLAAREAHSQLLHQYLSALESYDIADINSPARVDKQVRGIDRAPTKMIDDVVEKTLQHAQMLHQEINAENTRHYQQIQTIIVLVIVLAVLTGGVVTWLIIRSITRPVAQAVQVARQVASGDLRATIEVSGKDEIAGLMGALQTMNNSLARIVSEVIDGAENIADASASIADGSQALSTRNEAQASALIETAASMEEVTSAVKHTADNAAEANKLSQNTDAMAQDGNHSVERLVEAMGDINRFSTEINSIVTVIESIAFQTNILALNAAVEAARAGAEGRGFAVVASEVRALAQRSSNAAKEINSLISRTSSRIAQGNDLAGEAGVAMKQMLNNIRQVSQLVETISVACNQQSAGIEQVSLAVTQMDSATQQNATLSQQSSDAASQLHHHAAALLESVNSFTLKSSDTARGYGENALPALEARPA